MTVTLGISILMHELFGYLWIFLLVIQFSTCVFKNSISMAFFRCPFVFNEIQYGTSYLKQLWKS